MSARKYTPHADSVASRLIEHLAAAPEGARLTRNEIAQTFGGNPTNISTLLAQAVEHGMLAFTTEGKTRYYHLPVESEGDDERPGPLAIANDSSGDLWFSGARVTTNGEVLLSADQLQQLVRFATTAPAERGALEPQS